MLLLCSAQKTYKIEWCLLLTFHITTFLLFSISAPPRPFPAHTSTLNISDCLFLCIIWFGWVCVHFPHPIVLCDKFPYKVLNNFHSALRNVNITHPISYGHRFSHKKRERENTKETNVNNAIAINILLPIWLFATAADLQLQFFQFPHRLTLFNFFNSHTLRYHQNWKICVCRKNPLELNASHFNANLNGVLLYCVFACICLT